jgi:NADH:ubiquinone oxidoreductase subunit E
MKKIVMKICTGTMCHVLGGAELPEMAKDLQIRYQGKLSVKGASCMGHCKEKENRPPFIEIDGFVLNDVTKESIVEYLDEQFGYDREE